jgi:hypothetical protein
MSKLENSKSTKFRYKLVKFKEILNKKNFVIFAIGITVGIAISAIANFIGGVHVHASDISKTITDWMTAVGTVGAVIVSLWFSLSALQNTRRSEQNQYLDNAFRLLNDNAQRNARRRCINLFEHRENPSDICTILAKMGASPRNNDHAATIYLESREIVKADFEQLGYLVYRGRINEKDFLNFYWREISRCWQVLKWNIDEFRSSNPSYMENFEKLYCGSLQFNNNKDADIDPDVTL